MKQRVLVLFAHGARDSRWAEPFQRLQQITQAHMPEVTVALAFLELMTPALPDLVNQHAAAGCTDFTIVPVFLGQGGHVRRDLPEVVDKLRAAYPQARFTVATAVGESPEVLGAIASYCIGALKSA